MEQEKLIKEMQQSIWMAKQLRNLLKDGFYKSLSINTSIFNDILRMGLRYIQNYEKNCKLLEIYLF